MKTTIDFTQDNFTQRRASQAGAGVAYDPESLLTGEEIEQGLDYDAPRAWSTGLYPTANRKLHDAQMGLIPTSEIPYWGQRVYSSPEARQHAAMARACHPPVVDQWTLDYTAWRNNPDRMARFTAEVDPVQVTLALNATRRPQGAYIPQVEALPGFTPLGFTPKG